MGGSNLLLRVRPEIKKLFVNQNKTSIFALPNRRRLFGSNVRRRLNLMACFLVLVDEKVRRFRDSRTCKCRSNADLLVLNFGSFLTYLISGQCKSAVLFSRN